MKCNTYLATMQYCNRFNWLHKFAYSYESLADCKLLLWLLLLAPENHRTFSPVVKIGSHWSENLIPVTALKYGNPAMANCFFAFLKAKKQ